MLDLTQLDHAGVIVESGEDAINFYTATLGMEHTGTASSEQTGDTYVHLVARGDDGAIESHVELVEVSAESPLAEAGMDEPGLNHVAYEVKDVEGALEELEAAGCETVLPATVIDDITFAYVHTHRKSISSKSCRTRTTTGIRQKSNHAE